MVYLINKKERAYKLGKTLHIHNRKGCGEMALFGCCLPLGSFVPQIGDKEKQAPDTVNGIKNGLEILRRKDFDFCELTAGAIAGLSQEEFFRLSDIIHEHSYSIPVFNSFIPSSLPLTGLDVDKSAIVRYLDKVMNRIRSLGGKLIVFGSGRARSIPEGFPVERGKDQLNEFLILCNECGKKNDLTIAVEPLNRKECNVINTVKEGLKLVNDLKLPHIKLLADTYHMYEEGEPLCVLEQASEHLVHVHLSEKARGYPGQGSENGVDFVDLANVFKNISYDGYLSFECNFQNFEEECGRALGYIKRVWSKV